MDVLYLNRMALFYIGGRADMFDVYDNSYQKVASCSFWDDGAYPFIIVNDNAYIGNERSTHSSVVVSNEGLSEEEFDKMMDDAMKNDDYDEMQRLNDIWEKSMNSMDVDKHVAGRIFLTPKTNYSTSFRYQVISFWGDANKDRVISKVAVEKIIKNFNVSENNLLVAVFTSGADGELVPYNEWKGSLSAMDDVQKQGRAIHLMNSRDKRNATDDFRRVRDRKIGRKLTNDKGEEMPMAKYRSLFPENKQYKINKQMGQHIKLNENDLRRIVRKSINNVLNENYAGNNEDDELEQMFSEAWRIKQSGDYRAAMQFVNKFIKWMQI